MNKIMSSKYQSQIWDKNSLDFSQIDEKALTRLLVAMLREHHPHKPKENIAFDLGIPHRRVKNWMYENTRMTALDLILQMQNYDSVLLCIMRIVMEWRAKNKRTMTAREILRKYRGLASRTSPC